MNPQTANHIGKFSRNEYDIDYLLEALLQISSCEKTIPNYLTQTLLCNLHSTRTFWENKNSRNIGKLIEESKTETEPKYISWSNFKCIDSVQLDILFLFTNKIYHKLIAYADAVTIYNSPQNKKKTFTFILILGGKMKSSKPLWYIYEELHHQNEQYTRSYLTGKKPLICSFFLFTFF